MVTGYVLAAGFANPYLATAVCISGIVIGDNILYFIGRKGGNLVRRYESKLNRNQLDKYSDSILKYAGKTIFASRFVAGLRVFVPLLSGTLKVKWKTFFIYNFIAAILNISILVFLGYYFESELSLVISRVETTRHILALGALSVIGLSFSVFISYRFFKKNGS